AVFAVAHGDDAGQVARHFDAITTAVAAVTGLAPARLRHVFHCSAASKMRARDAARGSASARIRSKIRVALRTSEPLSSVTSSTPFIYSTSGAPSQDASWKPPLSPALAPVLAGTIPTQMFGRPALSA